MRARKDYQQGEIWKNLQLALHGSKHRRVLRDLLYSWQQLFALSPEPGILDRKAMRYYGHTVESVNAAFREQAQMFRQVLKDSIVRRDGTSLRELATAIEDLNSQHDPQRLWLMALCFSWVPPRKQKAFYTTKQLVEFANKRIGWRTDQRRMNAICDQLGIKREKAREGRPRNWEKLKSKQS